MDPGWTPDGSYMDFPQPLTARCQKSNEFLGFSEVQNPSPPHTSPLFSFDTEVRREAPELCAPWENSPPRAQPPSTGVLGNSLCAVIRNSRGHCLNFPIAFKNFARPGRAIHYVRSHHPLVYWGISSVPQPPMCICSSYSQNDVIRLTSPFAFTHFIARPGRTIHRVRSHQLGCDFIGF